MSREDIINSNLSDDEKYIKLMELKHEMFIQHKFKSFKTLKDFIPSNIKYKGEVSALC